MAIDTAAVEALARWREHPAQFVREVFGATPEAWQDDVLEAFPRHQRIAMRASKAVGKTACLAWLAWNFLLTRPFPKIAVTSVSADNLADNFWTETATWMQKSPLLQRAFEWTKTRITARDHPETWWMAARSWSKTADRTQQSATLAGLHSDYLLFVLDESGDIPDAVMASAEAALASGVETHIVQAGNPTRLDGPLWRACNADRADWYVMEVNGDPDNPKRSSRVSIEWARQQIRTWGIDSPWVLVNVFGRFPPASLDSLIGIDELREATQRVYREGDYVHAAKVLGVDVARFGGDKNVIFPRQGLVAFDPIVARDVTGTEGAALVARKIADWDADATFVDDTGGYGASWIDNLVRTGHSPIGIGFASKALDPRYFNRRAEMVFECVQWIKRGGRIPDVPPLLAALSQTTYTIQGDRFLIEPKEQIKARLGYSPDEMDGLILTFAQPVAPRPTGYMGGVKRGTLEVEHDPYRAAREVAGGMKAGNPNGGQGWWPGRSSPFQGR